MRFFFFPNDRCRGRRFLLPLLAMGAQHNITSEARSSMTAPVFDMRQTKAYYEYGKNAVRHNREMTERIVDELGKKWESESPGIMWLAGDSYMDAAYFARRNESADCDATATGTLDPDAVWPDDPEADPFYKDILAYQLRDIVTHTNRALKRQQVANTSPLHSMWRANEKKVARFVAVMAAQAGSLLRNRGNLNPAEGESNMIPNDEVIHDNLVSQKDVIVAHVGGNDFYQGEQPILVEVLQDLLGPKVLQLLKKELPEGEAFDVRDIMLAFLFERVQEIWNKSCEEKSDIGDETFMQKVRKNKLVSKCEELTCHAAKKICERFDFASQKAAKAAFDNMRDKLVEFVVATLTQKLGELYEKHLAPWLTYLMRNGAPALTLLMPPPRPLESFLLQFARSEDDKDPNGEGAVLPRIMAGLDMKPNMQKQLRETLAVLRSGERSPSGASSAEISTSAGELSSEPGSRTTSASSIPQNSDAVNFPEEAGPAETESAGSSPPASEDASSVKSELVAVLNEFGRMISSASATHEKTNLAEGAGNLIERLIRWTTEGVQNAKAAQLEQKLDEMKTALVLMAIQVYKPIATAVDDPAAISQRLQNQLETVISFFITDQAQVDKYTTTCVRLWAAAVAGMSDVIDANAGDTTTSSSQNNDLGAQGFESLMESISANYPRAAFLENLGWTAGEAKEKIVELAKKLLPKLKHVAKAFMPKNLHTKTLAAILDKFLSDCLRSAQKPLQTQLANTIKWIKTEHEEGTTLHDAKIGVITTDETLKGEKDLDLLYARDRLHLNARGQEQLAEYIVKQVYNEKLYLY